MKTINLFIIGIFFGNVCYCQFASFADASVGFGDYYNGESIISNTEIGALVYQDSNGNYNIGDPVYGDAHSVDGNNLLDSYNPDYGTPVGVMHTHGDTDGEYVGEELSQGDIDLTQQIGDLFVEASIIENSNLDVGVTTPGGNIQIRDGDTGLYSNDYDSVISSDGIDELFQEPISMDYNEY